MTTSESSTSLENDHTVPRPVLETERLILRAFKPEDAEALHEKINDREIAANTRTIPYPYPEGAGLEWIGKHELLWNEGKAAVYGAFLKSDDDLVGAVGLEISSENHNAEMGYWVGRKYWGQGYCTEACHALVEFGFDFLALRRIHAHHLTRNPASGRVMEKLGMKKEGLLRQHVRKWGEFCDIQIYGILGSEFEARK